MGGIAALEQAMATCYGGRPFIHVPRETLAYASNAHLLTDRNGRLYTDSGSIVVPGAGYTGTGPDGSGGLPGTTVWFYATGKVKAWSSAIDFTQQTVAEAVYRPTNRSVIIAKQWWMLGWDCCHFAVQVDLTSLT
jgi:hypothetical protein